MRKILKSKKGISPILATLLLIVIAVAAVIVTYAWVMTFTTTQTQKAGAVLTWVNTRFYNVTSTKYIDITLQNTGTADAKIVSFYIGTSSGNLAPYTTLTYAPSTQIVSANGGSLTATITYQWVSGTTYYFKFLSDAGQTLPFNNNAP